MCLYYPSRTLVNFVAFIFPGQHELILIAMGLEYVYQMLCTMVDYCWTIVNCKVGLNIYTLPHPCPNSNYCH